MESFRTNKKDRETFARVLGWTSTTRAIYSNDKTEIFRGINVNMGGNETWQFCNNGYQRVIARLLELGAHIDFHPTDEGIQCLLYDGGEHFDERSTETGEALFRAVVAMGEAIDGLV